MPTTEKTRYHHGNLRPALLDAAEDLLAEEGLGGLKLRAVARKAGVSPMAPAHHFGNLTGLLTALAIRAAHRLHQSQVEEIRRNSGNSNHEQQVAAGVGYVAFALRYPSLFDLLFSKDLVNRDDPELQQATAESSTLIRQLLQEDAGPIDSEAERKWLHRWGLVHGLAVLLRLGLMGEPPASEKEQLALVRRILEGRTGE